EEAQAVDRAGALDHHLDEDRGEWDEGQQHGQRHEGQHQPVGGLPPGRKTLHSLAFATRSRAAMFMTTVTTNSTRPMAMSAWRCRGSCDWPNSLAMTLAIE